VVSSTYKNILSIVRSVRKLEHEGNQQHHLGDIIMCKCKMGYLCIHCRRLEGEKIDSCTEPNQDPNAFWMLHVEGGSSPSKKHYNYTEALTEAERLLKSLGKSKVYILQVHRALVTKAPPVEYIIPKY
jgi:hypothetical protein